MGTRKKKESSDDDERKRCIDTFVSRIMKKENAESQKYLAMYTSMLKQALQKDKNNPKQKEAIKTLRKTIRDIKKNHSYTKSLVQKTHEKTFCNIGCKKTILEPGSPNMTPPQESKSEYVTSFLKERRKQIFGNNRNVLIDNRYYNKAEKKFLEKIKDQGAISFCHPNKTFGIVT